MCIQKLAFSKQKQHMGCDTHSLWVTDSSVYPTLIGGVAGWGRAIKKQACANHACKCYRAGLEALAQQNPAYNWEGGAYTENA